MGAQYQDTLKVDFKLKVSSPPEFFLKGKERPARKADLTVM
jgi:hypothetical protein